MKKNKQYLKQLSEFYARKCKCKKEDYSLVIKMELITHANGEELKPEERLIDLPIERFSGGTNFTIDWGDGSPITKNTIRHSYSKEGTYVIRVKEPVVWSHTENQSPDTPGVILIVAVKMTEIDFYKKVKFVYRSGFDTCTQLKRFKTHKGAIIETEDMSYFFNTCPKLEVIEGLEDWDVSKVKNMSYMFLDTEKLVYAKIDNWDVSNVINFKYCFSKAFLFNPDISNWVISPNLNILSNLNSMFNNTQSFNRDLSSWDFSNVGVVDTQSPFMLDFLFNTFAWVLPKPKFKNS